LVFKCGTSAQSLMARIILLPYACLHKRGGKFLGTKMPRSSSQFSPTKICEASAKRLRQLLTQFFFPRCAANALQILRSWRKFSKTCVGQALPLPATGAAAVQSPSLNPSVKRSISPVRNQLRFWSPARFISPAKFSLTSAVNQVPSKNARNDPSITTKDTKFTKSKNIILLRHLRGWLGCFDPRK